MTHAHAEFHSYADGTPRGEEPPPEPLEPFEDTTWTGDALGRGLEPWPRVAIATGALAAVGIALGLAWSAREAPEAPALAPAITAPPPTIQVEVAQAPPVAPLPATASERLDVLPSNVPATPTATPPEPVAEAQPADPTIPPAPEPTAPSTASAAADAVASAPPAPLRTDFDCPRAPTRASAMVCRDRGLATMDQRMKRAYAVALAAGASPEKLRAAQDRWLDAREAAAEASPRAVADAYRARIAELRGMARRD